MSRDERERAKYDSEYFPCVRFITMYCLVLACPVRAIFVRESKCVGLIIHKYSWKKTSIWDDIPRKVQGNILVSPEKEKKKHETST